MILWDQKVGYLGTGHRVGVNGGKGRLGRDLGNIRTRGRARGPLFKLFKTPPSEKITVKRQGGDPGFPKLRGIGVEKGKGGPRQKRNAFRSKQKKPARAQSTPQNLTSCPPGQNTITAAGWWKLRKKKSGGGEEVPPKKRQLGVKKALQWNKIIL